MLSSSSASSRASGSNPARVGLDSPTERLFVGAPRGPLPLSVVGGELLVHLASGAEVRFVHLDVASTAPCLTSVRAAVDAALPWYGSAHRGAGLPSIVTTDAVGRARRSIARFVGARNDDTTIFTRSTTDAIALLASCLPADAQIVSFASEHHANLLPWRRFAGHVELPVPRSIDALLRDAERALSTLRGRHRLLAVTGASNVTGELFPVDALARLARRHGARIFVDAAQLAPHRPLDLAARGIDWAALSGHKLYAPFGAGALVGRSDWLDEGRAFLPGGGAVVHVGAREIEWKSGAARHEGGSPNALGIVALAAACEALRSVGFEAIVRHEASLRARLLDGLRAIDGVETLHQFGAEAEAIGVVAFTVRGVPSGLVAAALAAEHGIGVRDGAFCAHPLVRALVGDGGDDCSGDGGAVRASVGAGSRSTDVERLVCAVEALRRDGPRARYTQQGGRPTLVDDRRARPEWSWSEA